MASRSSVAQRSSDVLHTNGTMQIALLWCEGKEMKEIRTYRVLQIWVGSKLNKSRHTINVPFFGSNMQRCHAIFVSGVNLCAKFQYDRDTRLVPKSSCIMKQGILIIFGLGYFKKIRIRVTKRID